MGGSWKEGKGGNSHICLIWLDDNGARAVFLIITRVLRLRSVRLQGIAGESEPNLLVFSHTQTNVDWEGGESTSVECRQCLENQSQKKKEKRNQIVV